MVTAVFVAALLQTAAINGQRDGYIDCLDKARVVAKSQNIAADGIEAHLRSTCASAGNSFVSALVAFDVKNKVPRKQATADAQLQLDDFIATSVSQYKKQ